MNRKELLQDIIDAEEALSDDLDVLAQATEWVKRSEQRVKEAKEALEYFDDPRTFSEKWQDMMWENYLERTTKN